MSVDFMNVTGQIINPTGTVIVSGKISCPGTENNSTQDITIL